MRYPKVTEINRAGEPSRPAPISQRELVELSLRANPDKTVRRSFEHEHPRGIFR
jgi:hypothetical protein